MLQSIRFIHFCILGFMFAFTGVISAQESNDDFDWRSNIQLTPVSSSNWGGSTYGSAWYRDIMNHSKRRFTGESPMTNCHETTHHLNADVRNAAGGRVNTVYVGDGQAGLVPEPNLRPAVVRDFIPAKMKSRSRYQTYMVNQLNSGWSDRLLYIFDEWSGYHSDIRSGSELFDAGRKDTFRGEICNGDGAVEFLYFAAASIVALEQREPQYLENLQFKSMFAFLAESTAIYTKKTVGNNLFDCTASKDLDYFINAPELDATRQVLKRWMGAGWTIRVLGF